MDTSGSMAGASIQQARLALDEALAALAPGDRFNVIQFNSKTERLFSAPPSAGPAEIERARRWVRGSRPTAGPRCCRPPGGAGSRRRDRRGAAGDLRDRRPGGQRGPAVAYLSQKPRPEPPLHRRDRRRPERPLRDQGRSVRPPGRTPTSAARPRSARKMEPCSGSSSTRCWAMSRSAGAATTSRRGRRECRMSTPASPSSCSPGSVRPRARSSR